MPAKTDATGWARRQQAVAELDGGANVDDVARRYGVSKSAIYHWRRALVERQRMQEPEVVAAHLASSTIGRLERENRKLRQVVVQQAIALARWNGGVLGVETDVLFEESA